MTAHLQQCQEKDIICPEVGCGCIIRNSILKRHLLEDCKVSKKRRQILKEKEDKIQREKERARKEREDKERELEAMKLERERIEREREESEENIKIAVISSDVKIVEKEIVLCKDCGESVRASQVFIS